MIRSTENASSFIPKEIPSLNIYCLNSIETWNNLRRAVIMHDRLSGIILDWGFAYLILLDAIIILEILIFTVFKINNWENNSNSYLNASFGLDEFWMTVKNILIRSLDGGRGMVIVIFGVY